MAFVATLHPKETTWCTSRQDDSDWKLRRFRGKTGLRRNQEDVEAHMAVPFTELKISWQQRRAKLESEDSEIRKINNYAAKSLPA